MKVQLKRKGWVGKVVKNEYPEYYIQWENGKKNWVDSMDLVFLIPFKEDTQEAQ